MKITVEFTGVPRSVVGQKRLSLTLPDGSTYREVVRRLATDYPDLVGLVIDRDGETFLSSNMFVINGDLSTPAMLLDEVPPDGAHLILMSLITGGEHD
jgi:hypothetical protein